MIDGVVSSGLLYYLDGIKNRGVSKKHRNDATTWVNLANENQIYDIYGDPEWNDTGLVFLGQDLSQYILLGECNPEKLTLECIVRVCAHTYTENTIITNYESGGYGIIIDNNGYINCSIYANDDYQTVKSSSPITLGEYIYISLTFDGQYIKLYRNNNLIDIKDLGNIYKIKKPENDTMLMIGANPRGMQIQANPFNGEIHSIRLYNRVLTDSELTQNYEIDSVRYPRLTKKCKWIANNKTYFKDTPAEVEMPEGRVKKVNNGDILCGRCDIGAAGSGTVTYSLCAIAPVENVAQFKFYSYSSWRNSSLKATVIYKDVVWYIHGSYKGGSDYAGGFPYVRWILDNPLHFQNAARDLLNASSVEYEDDKKDDEDIYKGGRVKYVRVRSSDGNYSNALAFIVDSDNVDFEDNRSLTEHLDEKALESIYSENGINLGRSNIIRDENEDIIKGENSAAIGHMVHAEGDFSLATGSETVASGLYAHAEGKLTEARGQYSHAEGGNTIAEGLGSHAEGYYTKAIGEFSHAEGELTEAKGKYSHAEGSNTIAEGESSLALGNSTVAKGKNSIAAGVGTIASSDNQFVHGTFNIEDTEGKYLEIIGNGTDNEHRSNAYAITKTGDVEFSGKITAEEFDGPAIYDIQGQEIADYVNKIEIQNGNELLVTKGSGAEEVITLNGWENIQEKIGSWSCKNGNIINRSEKKIVNFGYINRTVYRSACIFYCQLVLYANPSAEKDTVEIDFRLYIDDVEYDSTWNPKETLKKGYHVITLMCPIRQIQPDKTTVHMITVKAKTGGGSASYETGGIRAAFFGMGVDSGDVRWDGKIVESENLHKLHYNITFEEDDSIHKDYMIYQEKMHADLVYRTGLIEVIRHNPTDNIFEHNGDMIKGLHYNITFEEDDYIHRDYNIQLIELIHDALKPNQDKKLLPDLVMLKFKILGEYNSKYNYNPYYIAVQNETDTTKLSDANLLLQQFFSSSSNNFEIDTGRAVSLGINFSQFSNIDTVQVKEVV